jgi:hypothetical protein
MAMSAQHPLNALVLGDLVGERGSLLRPGRGRFKRHAREPDSHRRDIHAAAIEHRHRDPESASRRSQQVGQRTEQSKLTS